MASDLDNLSFEAKLERLKEIVDKMENEMLPLDESIKLYSEGQELLNNLNKQLSEAEMKIKTIREEKDLK